MNEFSLRNEILLVEYNDIIKSVSATLLRLYTTMYREDIQEFIHMDKLDNVDENDLELLAIARLYKDITKSVSKSNFDYEFVTESFINGHNDIYMISQPLKFADVIHSLLPQKFLKQIYIYHETNDERVERDIAILFGGSDRISFVTGDFKDVVEVLDNVTLYVLSDVDKMKPIIELNKQEYCEFMIADCGYNYELKDGITQMRGGYDKMEKEKLFKLNTFSPV